MDKIELRHWLICNVFDGDTEGLHSFSLEYLIEMLHDFQEYINEEKS